MPNPPLAFVAPVCEALLPYENSQLIRCIVRFAKPSAAMAARKTFRRDWQFLPIAASTYFHNRHDKELLTTPQEFIKSHNRYNR